jgi:UDP-glucose 6-dehydrogenase
VKPKKVVAMNFTVFGVGRLGLCFSLKCEKKGYNILGVDIVESYVKSLNEKTFLSDEPNVTEALQSSKNFKTTISIDEGLQYSNNLFIFLPTPTGIGEKSYDHSLLSKLLQQIVSDFLLLLFNNNTIVLVSFLMIIFSF